MKVRPEVKGGSARLLLTSFFFAILIFFSTMIPGHMAQAQTNWVITSGGDSGAGTLRYAIDNAADGDSIEFSSSVTTVTLTSDSLQIIDTLDITGPVTITRGGANEFRIFEVDSSGLGITVSMSHLTIDNGYSADPYIGGGGLYVAYADTVNLYDCTLQHNHTREGVSSTYPNGADGGAIYNAGDLWINKSIIKLNSTGNGANSGLSIAGSGGKGGGIYNQGNLHITESTIAQNTTGDGESKTTDSDIAGDGGDGAGIFSASGSVEIERSTINNNVTGIGGTGNGAGSSWGGDGGSGGGIYFDYGTTPVTIINSTISGNYTGQGGDSANDEAGSGGDGGGIYTRMTGIDLQLGFCTITNNGVGEKGIGGVLDGQNGHGGGIYREAGTVTLWYTILANNSTLGDVSEGPDCDSGLGGIDTAGYSLIGIEDSQHATAPCTINGLSATDIVDRDPGLGLLQQNDPPGLPGFTQTHALKYGSPCLDAGETSVAGVSTDQRGINRPPYTGGHVDIGAFESLQYTLAGHVKDSADTAVPDVEMQGLPDNPLTDTLGAYSVVLPELWSGTVTPVKAGYNFNPTQKTYTDLGEDLIEEDYLAVSATTTHTISGFVKTAGEEAVSGVTLNGLPGPPVTLTDGSYSAYVADGFSGTVTPEKTGYTFDPGERVYTNVTTDQANQDYVATVTQGDYTISGEITLTNNTPLGGVQLNGYPLFDQTYTSDAQGLYEVPLPEGYTGTMSPSKPGYRFTPTHVFIDTTSVGVDRGRVTIGLNQDFVASEVAVGEAPQPVPAGTLQTDYIMSVLGVHPLTATAVGVFGIPAADYDTTQIRIGRWNPATAVYDEYPLTGETDILPGWTAWVLSRTARTFDVEGYAPDTIAGPTGNGVYFPVKAGWNQVGNPFDHGINMGKVRFVNQSTETNITFWIWDGAAGDYLTISPSGVLPARQGGWINAPTSGWIFFEESATTAVGKTTENLLSAPADSERPPDPPGQLNNSGSGGLSESGGGGCFIQTLAPVSSRKENR